MSGGAGPLVCGPSCRIVGGLGSGQRSICRGDRRGCRAQSNERLRGAESALRRSGLEEMPEHDGGNARTGIAFSGPSPQRRSSTRIMPRLDLPKLLEKPFGPYKDSDVLSNKIKNAVLSSVRLYKLTGTGDYQDTGSVRSARV